MKKALKLMEIFSENHTKPISEKYAMATFKVAALEERIKNMMDFGMIDKSKELSASLLVLLEEIVSEYKKDNP